MKIKTIVGMVITITAQLHMVCASEARIVVGSGGQNPPGITVVEVYAEPVASTAPATPAPPSPATPGVTVTEVNPVAAVTGAGPTYNFQPQITVQQSQQAASPLVYVEQKPKCSGHGWRHFWGSCGCSVSLTVSAGIVADGPPIIGSHWERNDDDFEWRHYGVIPYRPASVVSYGPSYTYVDNYRSPLLPRVTYIRDARRDEPVTRYRPPCAQSPGPRPPHGGGGSHGGGHGGRPGR